MSNYSLPLFMQVKANAVTDLNKNLNLYMPKLVFAKTLILTTEGLLQTLDRKVKILLNQLRGYEIVTVKESSFDFAVEVAKKVAMNNIRLVIGLGGGTALIRQNTQPLLPTLPILPFQRLSVMTVYVRRYRCFWRRTDAATRLLLKFRTAF